MSIQGIRSFDNAERQSIQFGTPLTLIVGQNGTGKTTIIECLRYATTGDLPPNSKGGAFIHDPKISAEKEVLAQVKLAFISTNGTQMICTRSMQLTIKKTARTFKTLEGQLMAMKGKERETVSSRCAELDQQIPLYLGASKAVLDYVIFCHQEDSLWPLAEPSTVKKRFDEIFEATKFTKALDNIKALRKEYATDIKLQEKETQHLKVEKERAEKAEKKAAGLKREIERYKEDTEVLQTEIDQVNAESSRLFESNREFQNILYKIQNLKHNRGTIEDNIKRVSHGLDKRAESNEELQSLLDNFESRTEERKRKIEDLQDQVDSERINIKEYRQKYNQAILTEGQLKAKQQTYNEQVERRNKFIKESVASFDLVGFDDLDNDLNEVGSSSVHSQFQSQLKDLLSDVNTRLERERNNAKSVENDFNKELQEATTKRLREENNRSNAKEIVRKTGQEIQDLKTDIDSVTTDEGTLSYEKSLLTEFEQKLKEGKTALESFDYDGEISKLNKQIGDLDNEVDELNKQLAISNQRSEDRAKLSLLNNDLKRKGSALQELVDKYTSAYKSTIGEASIDPATMENSVTQALKKAQSEVDELNEEAASTEKQMLQIDNELTMEQNSRERKEESVKSHKTEILSKLNLTSISDYPGKVKECEERYYKALEELSMGTSNSKLYENSIKVANKKNSCLHCRREFNDEEEKDGFIELMKSWLASQSHGGADSLQARVNRADQDLKACHEMGSLVEEVSKLTDTDIPQISGTIRELQQQRDSISQALDDVHEKQEQAKDRLSNVESLKRPTNDIARYKREISDLEHQVSEINEEVGDTMSGSVDNRSTTEIHKDITARNEEAKDHKRRLATLIEEREKHRSSVSYYQNKISSKQLDINKLEHALNDKTNKEKQVEYLKERITNAKKGINEANSNLEGIVEEEKSIRERMTQELRTCEQKIQSINDKYTSIHKAIKDYDYLSENIKQYENENRGVSKLEKCRMEVEDYSDRIQRAEERIESYTGKINDEEKALLDMKSHERSLRDNLELRRLEKELADTDKSISELEAKNAEHERDKFEEKSEKLRKKLARLNSEYSSKVGEIKQMGDQLGQVEDEIETEYKTVKDDYQKALIKFQTTTIANDDLGKYSKALDSAIMKYHSLKMEEINSIIDELWKKTYTGTDIDTIIIRSDQENSRGNRTYNYRVCMVKQDVELDMRGRCSAGQKVLASIIIRLALSECFGVSCGLIALDEPTTNLDAPNIESLACSLSSIIELRQSQKNFQLIVITHDEQFLAHMNASAHADHFYRVFRNSRQFSQIQRVPISRVME